MKSKNKKQLVWFVRLYFLLGICGGILAGWMLFAIPTDPKNATLWGYSPLRVAFMIFIIGGLLLFLGLLIRSLRNTRWVQSIITYLEVNALDTDITGFVLIFVTILITVSGIVYLIWTYQMTNVFVKAYLVRISPIIFWLTAIGVQTFLLLTLFGYQNTLSKQNFQKALIALQIWIKTTNLYLLLSIITLLVGIFLIAFFIMFPSHRELLTEEDNLLENYSAQLYLFGFILSLSIIIWKKWWRLTSLVIPIACLWFFLEEISYGQRIFGSIPMIAFEENVDGLHDYFEITYRIIIPNRNNFIPSVLFVVIVVGFLVFAGYKIKQKYKQPFVAFGPLFFSAISGIFILISLVLDLEFNKTLPFVFAEEILEFFGAIALLFGAIAIYQSVEIE